jgi:hypothetical protein
MLGRCEIAQILASKVYEYDKVSLFIQVLYQCMD